MRVFIAAIAMSLLFTVSVRAEGMVNRYQIFEGNMVILLDTVTGKTWRFSEPMGWFPMAFMQTEEAAVSPEGSKSAIEMWEEDSQSRKLNLKKPEIAEKDGTQN
jgi:hypothetical protein